MKKLYLSLGAILFSGVLLASCGSNSGLSAPKKGKAVDSVKIKLDGDDVELKKDDKYEDVMDSILEYTSSVDAYYEEEGTGAFKVEESSSSKITAKNYIGYADSLKPSPKYKSVSKSVLKGYSPSKIFDKYSSNDSESSSLDYYYKENSKENNDYVKYLNSSQSRKASLTLNKDTSSMEMTQAVGLAGNYFENKEKVTVDAGKFESYSIKSNTKGDANSTNSNGSSSIYEYLDKTENKSDTDFGATYRGQAGFDSISYSITDFMHVDGPDIDSSVSLSNVAVSPIEGLADLYETNFELTDKYIILKCKVYYTFEMMYYARNEIEGEFSNEKMVSKIKELKDKEFKGTYTEAELWINYDVKDGDSDNIELTYSYFKSTTVTKKNIEKEITNDILEDYDLDKETYKDYVGKKQTIKEDGKNVITKAYSKDKYDSKIKSMKNKCKKNNIYDKITMIKDLGE